MRQDLKQTFLWSLGLALLLTLAMALGPSAALAQGKPAPGPHQAFLYEMSENAVLWGVALPCALGDARACTAPRPLAPGASPTGLVVAGTSTPGFPLSRRATSQLQGVAALGSLLCPSELLLTIPNLKECTVTATGSDNVALNPVVDSKGNITGFVPTSGSVSGTYAVVVQLDNPVDSPEFPAQTGTFSGTIAFEAPLPLAFLQGGTVTIDGVEGFSAPFSGTFRMPFAKGEMGKHDEKGKQKKPQRHEDAYYLLDNGKRVEVRQDERAVGWATVRLEITF